MSAWGSSSFVVAGASANFATLAQELGVTDWNNQGQGGILVSGCRSLGSDSIHAGFSGKRNSSQWNGCRDLHATTQ